MPLHATRIYRACACMYIVYCTSRVTYYEPRHQRHTTPSTKRQLQLAVTWRPYTYTRCHIRVYIYNIYIYTYTYMYDIYRLDSGLWILTYYLSVSLSNLLYPYLYLRLSLSLSLSLMLSVRDTSAENWACTRVHSAVQSLFKPFSQTAAGPPPLRRLRRLPQLAEHT